MLDFQWLINHVTQFEKLYKHAQSEQDDAAKQAKTVLVYDTLIAELESCIEICKREQAMHRISGVRILSEQLRKP